MILLKIFLKRKVNHRQIRHDIAEFYASATDAQIRYLEEKHSEQNLRDRQIISHLGVWGESVDITAFCTIYNVSIRAAVIVFPKSKEAVIMKYHPIDAAGTQVTTVPFSTTVLHFNGTDHWSVL